MKHAPPALTRLVAWSVLLLGVSLGASACRDPAPPPPGSERPSAERSTVQVNPARGARANGQDLVEILVTVRDSRGNGLAGHTVTVEATGEGNTLTQASGPSDEQGVAIATLVSTGVGTKTVTAKVSSEGGDVTLGSKPTVDFGPVEAVAKLAFTTEPVSGTAGVALAAFEVTLQDAAGVKVASASDTVTVALAEGSPQAELKGTLSVAAVNGVARFTTVLLEKAGAGYTLVASAAGMAPATSASFDITAAAAKTLTFTKQPPTRGAGQAFAVDVTLTDAFGNLAPVTAPQVALTVNKGTLVGTSTVAPVAGAASFSGLSITEVGSGYVLTAAAEGLTSATSTAFDISADPVNACVGKVCEPAAPTCAADGVSRATYTADCVDEQGTAVCKQTETLTACTGANAVCFDAKCDTAVRPTADQLLVSEVMHSPSTGTTEYFELTNNTGGLLNLSGLTVSYKNAADAARSFEVGTGSSAVVVKSKGRIVFAQNKDTKSNGGVTASYQYPDSIVLDGSGSLSVKNGSAAVTEFRYTSAFPQSAGRSMNLASLVVGTRATAQSWYWCDSTQKLAGGDFGTPEAANSDCGIPAKPVVNLCYIQEPKTLPSTPAGTPVTIHGRFKAAGVTDRNTAGNDNYPYVVAELGFGPDSSNATTWTWAPASFNGEYTASVSDLDETVGTVSFPSPGLYKYGFRYAIKDATTGEPSTWVYCGQSDIADPANGIFGTVTVAGAPAPITDHVVISEFASKNLKADGTFEHNDEFIELYNPTNAAISLAGWRIQYASPTGAFNNLAGLNFETKSIAAKGYFLIAFRPTFTGPTPDATYTTATGHNGGSLKLLDAAGDKVDALSWGTGAPTNGEGTPTRWIDNTEAGGSYERKAVSNSTPASMAAGGPDATRGNGFDSDNNGNDFVIRAVRDPQNSASPPESP